MSAARARLRDWLPSPWFIAGIVLALVGVAVLVFKSSRTPGFALLGVPECRVAYTSARTAQDSSIIDLQHPSTGPQKNPNAPTCGTLRIVGALR
jgi:hypothetical protein